MINEDFNDDILAEIYEDAFVNIKEACLRLQERTKCSNSVVVKMLNDVSGFYTKQEDKKQDS